MKITFLLLAALALGLVIPLAASGTPANLVIILDASNSMNKPFGGETRISAARAALSDFVTRMPEEGNVGLLVFGHRINYQNEVESCQDISFLFPLAPFTRALGEDMAAAVVQVTPQGKTPLADSLTQAANAIAADGQGGAIVLISDGEGNCSGLDVVAAQMLATMTPPIALHVVGLDLEIEASEALRAMALETGGEYWGVADVEALIAALFAAIAAPVDAPVTSLSDSVPPEYACFNITNVVYGTEGDDVMYGTAGNDLIYGLSGDDFIIGLGGHDILVGGPGNDIIEGGVGNDLLDGGEGDDLLLGGVDNDLLCGGAGNDSLEGEAGDDVLDGGTGCDVLLGGRGTNTLYSVDALDILLEGNVVQGACPQCSAACGAPTCPTPPTPPTCAPMPATTTCTPPSIAKAVREGDALQLHGTVSDYDCNVLSVHWQVSAGTLNDPASLHPVFTAPMLTGCEDLEVLVTLTAVDSCGASGTDSFRLLVVNENHAPTAAAGPDLVVNEGDAVALAGTVGDPDGDPLSVSWVVNSPLGAIADPASPRTTFHAPRIDACDGIDIPVTLSVVDACGAMVCDTVVIRVLNVNKAPTVDLGPDFALTEGQTIRWTPVVSDPECEALTYCWSATAGSLESTTIQNPAFVAPLTSRCEGESIVVTLTVTDPCGLSATDSVCLHVGNVNGAPSVDLGQNACVKECSTMTLCPMVSDPDGDPLRFVWSVSAGRLDSTCIPTPVFIAPATECEGMDVTVTVTVTDPCGLTATDSFVIHVENVNQAPLVVADP
ncbi:MAG: VWA domain-containing protein [Candidatus Bipolaricaulota bacterium]